MTPTRSVALYLTPAEAVALYEASRYRNWNEVPVYKDGRQVDAFWCVDDWLSARGQLERVLRGENEFTDMLSAGVQKGPSS